MSARRKDLAEHPELGLPEVRSLWQKSGLFSDHYLKVRIAGNDWWPSDEQVRPVWVFCKDLVERRAFGLRRHGNEEEARQELIEPILERLGLTLVGRVISGCRTRISNPITASARGAWSCCGPEKSCSCGRGAAAVAKAVGVDMTPEMLSKARRKPAKKGKR